MRIRLANERDAAAIADIYAPYITDSVISFELEPPDAAEMWRRMQHARVWLVAEEDTVIGYAYASPHRERAAYRWCVEVSVYVQRDGHRKGVGRALYERLLADLTHAGYYNAYAGITLPNAASVGLHEALGFEPIGVYRNVGYKHGAWRDVGWWGRVLRPPTADPAEPAPIS